MAVGSPGGLLQGGGGIFPRVFYSTIWHTCHMDGLGIWVRTDPYGNHMEPCGVHMDP